MMGHQVMGGTANGFKQYEERKNTQQYNAAIG